jgi:periplasmic protein TonB
MKPSTKRSFTVPVAIALALHAGVLFGFKPGKPDQNSNVTPDPMLPDKTAIVVELLPEEKPEPIDMESAASASSRENTAMPPPMQPDPFVPEPTDAIFIERSVIPINVPTDPHAIKPGAIGPRGPGSNVGSPNIFSGAELDHIPRAKYQPSPEFPAACKNAGVTGVVEVEFWVDENGRVHDAEAKRDPHPALAAAAVRAVSKWKFFPGTHRGLPVPFRMTVPLVFSFSDE